MRYWHVCFPLVVVGVVGACGCAGLAAFTLSSFIQMAAFGEGATTEHPNGEETNGCGPQGALGIMVPECPLGLACFTSACTNHDLCYVACGSIRSACDHAFHVEMVAICAERYADGDPRLQACENLAYIYWQAVVRLGGSFFEEGQREHGCAVADLAAAAALGPAAVISPFPDADDDLLPDDWELAHGCDPTNPDDALVDTDGDGLVNLQEYLYGCDPLRPDAPGRR